MADQPLFRDEVLAARQTRWLGTVLLTPRLSHRLFAAFAVLAMGGVLGLLFLASYPRTARVSGWLVPQEGLVRVFAPQAGVVTGIHVREGGEVRQGDRLLTLSAELESAARGATQRQVVRQLEARRTSLVEARHELERLGAQQGRSLAERLAMLEAELGQLDREIALQEARLRFATTSEARQRELHASKLIADQQLQAAEEERLEQDLRLQALWSTRIVAERERLRLKGELADLPLKARGELASLDRNLAEVEQALAEVEARRELVVPAPAAGTVTAIQAEAGGRPRPDVPLLSIVPAGSPLEAQLFAPSRAIGFLRPGQRVLLRYQAYPYQKFGHHEGRVTHIARSALNPSELPPQLAGLTSVLGANEPIYRITVSLGSQTITAYGQPVALQAGMQLEADVVIEWRRLIDWVLDPLYTLTGKWTG